MAGIDMVGIPYKGGGQLITDLVGGQIQVGIAGTTPMHPAPSRRRASRSSRSPRSSAFRRCRRSRRWSRPASRASSPRSGSACSRRAARPAKPSQRLHAETVKALKLPDVSERLVKAALQPVGNTPEEFTNVIRTEIEQFGKLAKELGIEPQ